MTITEAWRSKARQAAVEEAKPLLLPSGVTVLARRPGPAMLASYSRLPTGLAAIASGSEAGGTDAEPKMDAAVFLYDLLTSCVVSPEISREPGTNRIHPKDIPDGDVTYLLAWALRGEEAASLATFRRGGADGNAGVDGGGVRATAEHIDGDHGSGAGAELRSGRRRSARSVESNS